METAPAIAEWKKKKAEGGGKKEFDNKSAPVGMGDG